MSWLLLKSLCILSLVVLLGAEDSTKTCQNTRIVMEFLINGGLPASEGDVYKDFSSIAGTTCQLEETCCSLKLEDALRKSVAEEYTSKIRNMLKDSLSPCKQSSIISETTSLLQSFKAQIIKDLGHVYKTYFNGHEAILDDMFNSFVTAIETGDTSNIADMFQSTFFQIYLSTYQAFPGIPSLPNTEGARNCFYRYFFETEGPRVEQLYNSFMTSFSSLMYYMRGLHTINQLIDKLTQHSLSEQCKASLLKMDKCSACAGYASLRSCKGLCVNLLRGCLVDLTDLEEPVLALSQVLVELNEQNMRNNIIKALVALEERIFDFIGSTSARTFSIRGQISSCYSSRKKRSVGIESRDVGEKRVKRQSHLVPRSQVEFPFEVFNETTTCMMERLSELLTLPENMCGATASRDDQNCWNGHFHDSYSRDVVSFSRSTQKNNPEVLICPSSQLQYELNVINYVTRELTSVSGKCSSDDEDCSTFEPLTNYYLFPASSSFKAIVISVDDEHEEGSGSGSGEEPVFSCESFTEATEEEEQISEDVVEKAATNKEQIVIQNTSGSIPVHMSKALVLVTISLVTLSALSWL